MSNRTLTEQERKKRHLAAAESAAKLSNEELVQYLTMMSDRAQSFTTYERKAFLQEAALRLFH